MNKLRGIHPTLTGALLGACVMTSVVSTAWGQVSPARGAAELTVEDSDSGFSLHASKAVSDKANGFAFMTNIVPVTCGSYQGKPFIRSISGVKPHGSKYWAMYINGVYSTNDGIADVTVTNGMTIGWKTQD